jgi:hypothetical protein
VSGPYCFKCQRNDKLTPLDPNEIYVRRPDYREMLKEIGGYENDMVSVPAKGIKPMVAEIEDLRKENIRLRIQEMAMRGENATYIREWIDTFRGKEGPVVDGVLRMSTQAIQWRDDAGDLRAKLDTALGLVGRFMSYQDHDTTPNCECPYCTAAQFLKDLPDHLKEVANESEG